MTLANLKKRGPSVKHSAVSVDQFIDDALKYANGCDNIVTLPVSANVALEQEQATLKRATFTLGEQAIAQLDNLSLQTGIAKSRLIRIWLQQQQASADIQPFLLSAIK